MRIWILVAIFFSRSLLAATCSHQDSYDLGEHYFKKNQFLMSSLHFSTAQKSSCSALVLKAKYNLILSFNQLAEFQEVRDLSRELSSSAFSEQARFLGAIYLDEIDGLENPKEKSRAALWMSKGDRNAFKKALEEIELEQAKRNSLDAELLKISRRSPGLASGFNAIVPGSGYAYVGAWQTAALSFVLNALFLSSAIDFGNKDMHGASLAAYSVFSVTYLGGIIGGHRVAKDYNNGQMRGLIEDWQPTLFPETQLRK